MSTQQAFEKLGGQAYVQVRPNPTRSEYLEEIQKRHVFLSFHSMHTGGITYLEMLLAGMVGVFWKADYVSEKLPNYPFVASSKVEAVSMLKYIYSHYEEAQQKLEPIRQYIRGRYSKAQWEGEYLEIVRKTIKKLFRETENE